MSLKEKLESEIRQAMRSRHQDRLDALRFLKNSIRYVEKNSGKTLDEQGLTQVVAKQIKDRRESIDMFRKGNRTDLVAKESAALAVLEEFLPPQLSQEELAQLVQEVISEVGATSIRDKGKVMGRLMSQVRGKAEGDTVNALVTRILESPG